LNVRSSRGKALQLYLLQELEGDLLPWALDERIRSWGYDPLAGVDEAGRGPLAGPLVAAAVILRRGERIEGLRDSKLMSPEERERVFEEISSRAVAVGLGVVEPEELDSLGMTRATRKAMERAVGELEVAPMAVVIDGPMGIRKAIVQFPMVKGDRRSHCVAAASVIAKVTRDRLMTRYHEMYPHYGFHRHKGYATKEHLEAIVRYGPCPIHRKSFRLPGCGGGEEGGLGWIRQP
jgi:ribonuclease HII